MITLGAVAFGVAVTCVALVVCAPAVRSGRTRTGQAGLLGRLRALVRSRQVHAAAGDRALEVLQATHAGLRSGLPLAPSLRFALERSIETGADPFVRALRAFELNASLDDGLRDAARDAGERRTALALEALALVAAEQLPASRAAGVIGSVADRLAFELRLADEIRARTSGLRAQIVLLAVLVPALALYLFVTMPGLAETLASPLGMFVLVPAAALFEAAGVLASRAIVRGIAL